MDITLPKNNFASLLEHPLVRGLLESTSDGAVVIDIESRRILYANPRACDLLGFEENAVCGESCKKSLNSPLCTAACMLSQHLNGVQNESHDVYYRGEEGNRFLQAKARMLVIRDPDGTPIAGIEFFQDVSATRALERALYEKTSLFGIIGISPPMQTLYNLIEQIAPYDLPVLLTGESGVGKERFADAIQFISERSSSPYLKVNCAALTPSLVESELFGHRRGAFTGATTDRPGRFEEADTGTIVLDEVGELPFSVQAKLLRVVQNGEIQRVGEDKSRKVDVRILAATNRNIEQEVANGTFREDLYYRLAGVRVHVPPLRERVEDIPLLVDHFLRRFSEQATNRGKPKSIPQITPEALTELTRREWRGNVRELENTLRLAFIRVPDGHAIQLEHLNVPGTSKMIPAPPPSLATMELEAIQNTLERCGGNVSATARILGIDRTTLWRKLKKAQAG